MRKGYELIKEIDDCALEEEKIAFWWLGQMGYALKIGKKVVYIDAYLSENPLRNTPPVLKPEEIVNADIIIGTHDHEDHIDRNAWHQMSVSSPNALFIVPKLLVTKLSKELMIDEHRFIGLDDNLEVNIDGITLTGLASAHEFLDQDEVTGCYPYLGFIIEGNGIKLYHSGDSCIYEGLQSKLKKFGTIDVMFLPINGRDATRYLDNCIGNMTYQEAVDLAGSLSPRLVVPGHYDMFAFNSEDPIRFVDYLNAKYKTIPSWVGDYAQLVLVDKTI